VLDEEVVRALAFGECVDTRVRSSMSYPAGLATVTSVLGPPGMVSGPDAGALWRLPDRHVSFSAGVTVTVEPRDAAESRDFLAAMHDGDYDPRYRWAAFPETEGPVFDTVSDLLVHGRRLAATWDDLAAGVGAVFGSLAADVPLLAQYVRRVMWRIGTGDDRYVQGWFTADECHLEAPTADLPTTAKNGITGLTLDSGSQDLGERIAGVAMTAIRAWGLATPAELTGRAWTTRSGSRLILFGVGL
jgi:hypothetical protein